MERLGLCLIAFLLLFSCKPKLKEHPIQFYHWKTKVELGEIEKEYLQELNSDKLYIRVFDIVQENAQSKPTAIIQEFDSKSLSIEYIPTIYIVNDVFIGISTDDAKELAENSHRLIEQIAIDNQFPDFNEIQIDCDWTESTRENYFQFLEELKTISNKKITSTLRLHQVKFKNKSGVPPIDKVYLMCYATSSPIEEIEKNSILDLPLLKDYLNTIDEYPLDLDVALPIYSWAIVTNHLGKKKLINAVSEEDLKTADYKKRSDGLYEVQTDVFLKGIYLNQGFKIKLETIPIELLKETRQFLDSKIKTEFDIVYYHLDATFLSRYSVEDLK